MRMHVEGIDAEVIGREPQQLEHLVQRHRLAIPAQDHIVRMPLDFRLDEAQQMLLIHTRTVVHMCIDFAHIVKVSMRHAFEHIRLAVLVQQLVQIPLAFEKLEPTPGKCLCWSI